MKAAFALLMALFLACFPVLGLAPAQAATSDQPGDYQTLLPLQIQGADTLQRLRLPLGVLQRLQSPAGRADVRVFDAQGRAMPLAWAQEPPRPAVATRLVALPPRPWPSDARGALRPASELRIQWQGTGGSISLQSGAVPGAVPGTVSGVPSSAAPDASARTWLLDLRPLGETRPRALQLDWPATGAVGLELTVQAEASADAQAWRPAGRATLVELPGAAGAQATARQVLQARLDLEELSSADRFLRLSAAQPWRLSLAQAELTDAVAGPDAALLDEVRWPVDAQGVVAPGAWLAPWRLRFHLAGDTGSLPLRVQRAADPLPASATRRGADTPWITEASTTAYRLQQQGQVLESPPLALPGTPARRWRLQAAGASDGTGAAALAASLPVAVGLQWVAPQLVFAASGTPPYRLALGRAQALEVARPLASLLPGYQAADEYRLAAAALAEPPAPWTPEQAQQAERDLGRPSGKALWLWAALAAAVLGLGILAWKLAREMRTPAAGAKPAPAPPPPPAPSPQAQGD